MQAQNTISFYGVHEQVSASSEKERAIEEIRHFGFTVVKGGYTATEMKTITEAFETAYQKQEEKYGKDYLKSIDEHNTIRLPFMYHDIFFDICSNPLVLDICRTLIGQYIVLNQQNGISNPPNKEKYNQGAYHRDLPYQHFVSTRPLAINALFCLDPFTLENGATYVIPASHKQEAFPSNDFIRHHEIQTVAEPGDYILMDCMVYHSGGINKTDKKRRAVNNVYTIPLIKQQISIPEALNGKTIENDALKKLLGIGISVPDSVESYYKSREKK